MDPQNAFFLGVVTGFFVSLLGIATAVITHACIGMCKGD